MKRVTFETGNSIGHIQVPDDVDINELIDNEVEPLTVPVIPQQNATEKLSLHDIAPEGESILPLTFGIEPDKTDEL